MNVMISIYSIYCCYDIVFIGYCISYINNNDSATKFILVGDEGGEVQDGEIEFKWENRAEENDIWG